MMLRKIKQNYIVLILIFLSVLTILILQNFGFKAILDTAQIHSTTTKVS